jgi:hypothetical protein
MNWEMKDWESTQRRYGLIDDLEGKGWFRGFIAKFRLWVDGFFGRFWRREGSLVGDW